MKMSEPVYDNIFKRTQDKNRRNKRQTPPQHTGSDSVKIKNYRAAVVCLVLLCVLLLTAVIVLCVHIHTNNTNYTEERNDLLTKITNLSEDRDVIQTKINKLTENRDELLTNNNKLAEVRGQLLTKNEELREERRMLTTKNENLLNERDLLINQRSMLCENGEWIYYQYSLYYMSNETNNWIESRQDCLKRGADLIIINDREEQDFVKNITDKREFWIGVTDVDVEGTWKWVDGRTLSNGFWASHGRMREPNGGRRENCAVTYLPQHPELIGWIDVECDDAYQWICEKSIQP